jgi:histidinol dehydrogenase
MQLRRLADLGEAERRALLDRWAPLEEVMPRVKGIVESVRRGGDRAVLHYTELFDGVRPRQLKVPSRRISEAWRSAPAALQGALRRAARNIEAYHAPQVPSPYEVPVEGDPALGMVGLRYIPYGRVGLYVPGGPRGYPSSLLMAAIPAHLGRVGEVAVASPPSRKGIPNEGVLAAAELLGVEEVYACGGAQAIAALAIGTESVSAVEKVCGPGNRYVTAAKALLRDEVAIDSLSGPSELLVVADGSADAEIVAWDLLSQAEHGPDAVCLLVATDEVLAYGVADALRRLPSGPGHRLDPMKSILLANGLEEALAFANAFAPEHLLLNIAAPRAALEAVRTAGCVFLGSRTPVTLGDYCIGTNHSLPTMGLARWQGPLGVRDFLKPVAYAEATTRGLAALADTARILAKAEAFEAHAEAVRVREKGGR